MKIDERKERFVEGLRSELAELQRNVAGADAWLAQMNARHVEAIAHHAEVKKEVNEKLESREFIQNDHRAFKMTSTAGTAEADARRAVFQATQRVNEIGPSRARAKHVAELIKSEGILAESLRAARQAITLVAGTKGQAEKNKAAVESLTAMVRDEERARDAARQSLAAATLAAVKAGSSPPADVAPNGERLSMLQLTLATAEAELASGRAAFTAAEQQCSKCLAEVQRASLLVAELHEAIAGQAADEAAKVAKSEAMEGLRSSDVRAAALLASPAPSAEAERTRILMLARM